MPEVTVLSERQEILKSMVENKIRLQSRATEKYYCQISQDKGAGRKEIRRGSATCAEEARCMEISE